MYPNFKRFGLLTTSLLFFILLTPTDSKISISLAQTVAVFQQKNTEVDQLFQQGITQFRTGQFKAALQTYQQVLVIRRNLKDKPGIAATLDNIGEVYTSLGDYTQATVSLQEALTIRQQIKDQAGIAETLNNQGYVQRLQGNYTTALQLHQQALEIAKKIGNQSINGEALHNIAAVYADQGDYDQALELYKQALVIRQEVGDKRDQGRTLNNIGVVYFNLGEYEEALKYYQQALTIRRAINDQAGVARLLSNIGSIYNEQSQYSQALEYYQQALPMLQEIGDKNGIGKTLTSMGLIYEKTGQYEKALEIYQQSLAIAKEIGDRAIIGKNIDNIGGISYGLGKYPQALDYYQQALAIRKQIGDQKGIADSLNNLAGVYINLGQYPQALELLQQALSIRQKIGDKAGESSALDGIGVIYEKLQQPEKALNYYQQALALAKQINKQDTVADALEHLGSIYTNLAQYSQAEDYLQQSLALRKQISDQAGEGRTINSIANLYYSQKQYPKALEFLQQSLDILQKVGDKQGESITLANLGYLLEKQDQPILAILFYKQAVNVTESIRKDLKSLSLEQQKSFTETVADTYRRLADLLLKRDRVIEAQTVLDLLKVQELDEYLKNVRGNEQTAQGIYLLPQEKEIYERYFQANIQQQQREDFNDFLRSREISRLLQQLNQKFKGENFDLSNLSEVQRNLQQIKKPAVLIYPLVLEDRLELVVVTPNSPPIHRPVRVKQAELLRVVSEFRQALTNPNADATIPARKLYNWLIKPIEKELADTKAQIIVYAPDGRLRYIPLAALFDGKQWLVQRFAINYITAASLTNLKSAPKNTPRVLAGAFATGSFNVPLGDREISLPGLPFAGKEVNNLAATINHTNILLDTAFNPQSVIPHLNDYNIIHFATHAAFVTGKPENSFILFGDGSRITFRDIETWLLTNVDLVVLSACETGVGGQLSNGKEILGFGYQIQKAGASAVIASLWPISDGGTQALMNIFYGALINPATDTRSDITKSEALREAQIALITGDYQALGEQRGIAVRANIEANVPRMVVNRLNHPYYWAPFILIGNGF